MTETTWAIAGELLKLTIQAGINAVSGGGLVEVGAGTFTH